MQVLYDRMDEELLELEGRPAYLQSRSRELLQQGIENGDCEDIQVAEFLALHAELILGLPHDGALFEQELDCPWQGSRLHLLSGISFLQSGELGKAIHTLEIAVSASIGESNWRQMSALDALAVAQIQAGNFPDALQSWEQAYRLSPGDLGASQLANLAYSSVLSGDCNEALTWIGFAQERIAQMAAENQLPEIALQGLHNAVCVTEAEICLSGGALEQALRAFKAVDWDSSFAMREFAAARVFTLLFQEMDDYSSFCFYQPLLRDLVTEDLVSARFTLGANADLLLSQITPNQQEWDRCRQVPIELRGGLGMICAKDIEEEVLQERSAIIR